MQQSADIGAGDKRQRDEHEEREEAQLSLAEPCLAHHVQLGRPEHVLLGSAEHGLLFLVAVGEVKVCREARNKTMRIFRKKTALWRQQEAHQLASAHAQVDQAFAKAKALSEGVQFELLTSCVRDSQWQPASDLERRRVIANKVLATTAVTQSSASASEHSTPARLTILGGTQQNELNRLDSSTVPSRTYVKNPEQIERAKAAKVAEKEQRRRDAADPPYHPGSDFQPDNKAHMDRLSQERERLSQVPQHVSDRTSRWSGTQEFLDIVTQKRLLELDTTSQRMREHFEITTGGVEGECAVWNIGGNPGYNAGPEFLERGLLPRLVRAIGVMVLQSFCVSDCTVLCFVMWLW